MTDLLAFATERLARRDRHEDDLLGTARYALRHYGQKNWATNLKTKAERLLRREYHAGTGSWTSPELRAAEAGFRKAVNAMIAKTTKPDPDDIDTPARLIAAALASSAVSLADELVAAEKDDEVWVKTWVSMEDERVRPSHVAAHGQSVPLGQKFDVGEARMDRPGDLTAPINEWAGCRCVLATHPKEEDVAASLSRVRDTDAAPLVAAAPDTGGGDMPPNDTDDDLFPVPDEPLDFSDDPVPFWGVIAPEDTLSGDGRKFAADSLRSRPLPLPLASQRVNEPGHDGSVKTGNIERMWRKNGLVFGAGHFLTSVPEVDELISVMAESGGRIGVSVDADDGTAEMHTRAGDRVEDLMEAMEPGDEIELDMDELITVFTSARVAGATTCNIPAFHEAFVALGEVPEEFLPGEGEDLAVESRESITAASEKAWDGSASRFTPEEWKRSCIVHLSDSLDKADHKLPIREPGGALSRAGVHAAAARLNQVDAPPAKISAAKSALRGAYKELGEDPPEAIAALVAAPGTQDGPGWLTHPVDTDRLRDYWVHGKGAALIGWGIPGDFNRCRMHLAKYIKPNHLSGYCANRHKDALGFWPGQEGGGRHSLAAAATAHEGDQMAPAIRLVETPDLNKPPAEWFTNPNLTGPSPIVVTEEGRIFGHLAAWGTCHIGINGVCTEPPTSPSNYAQFRTGYVLADNGDAIPTGVITMDTGHAGLELGHRAAVGHYDNTGFACADVAAGEDEWGIWVSGAVRDMTPSKLRALRAAPLSGDWREIGGELELVAALAVNVGGFPIPRVALAASGGRQTALVAAGMVLTAAGEHVSATTVEEIVVRTLTSIRETEARKAKMEALRQQRVAESREKMAALAARRNGEES